MKSIIFLWSQVKKLGFSYVCCCTLNQVPFENLFCNLRQHGISNTNPTCFQFTAALKTIVINNLSQPTSEKSNCGDDSSAELDSLCNLIIDDYETNISSSEEEVLFTDQTSSDLKTVTLFF